ncbi:nucleoside deaminase [Actinoplanes sp. CA-252034]|uniref:nucleoside deaminase n=1 Tax=Actinoplanes sp. CA-252034 TaxID=3239906 RepID=UPI003D95A031
MATRIWRSAAGCGSSTPRSTTITEPERWTLVAGQAWASYLAGGRGVGAVAADAGVVCAVAGNADSPDGSGLRHAEIEAISRLSRETVRRVTLYTSLEPCVLCLGALTFSRVPRVVFAARDFSFSAGHRALAGAPVLGARVPAFTGPLGGRLGAFCRLVPIVADLHNYHGSGRLGLEERLTPGLVRLARDFTRAADEDWPDVLNRLGPDLDEVANELSHAETRLSRLGFF